MKKLTLVFLCLLFCVSFCKAEVYWIGRSIELGAAEKKKKRKFVPSYGHSYVAVIPDDPKAFAKKYNPLDETAYFKYLEKDFGSGKKGFYISGYPVKGSAVLLRSDGNLVAGINEDLDMEPTKDFFADMRNNKMWNFVFGLVEHEGISDTDFAFGIYTNAQQFIRYCAQHRIDYNTGASILEKLFITTEEIANNCNSVAFSLLAYSNASKVPDLGEHKNLPGNRHLMPRAFFKGEELSSAGTDLKPRVLKNDGDYATRMRLIEEMRQSMPGSTQRLFMDQHR